MIKCFEFEPPNLREDYGLHKNGYQENY